VNAEKFFFARTFFATFANDRVTPPMHAQRWKNDYGRLPTFPKKSENARRALAKTSWCDGSLREVTTCGSASIYTILYTIITNKPTQPKHQLGLAKQVSSKGTLHGTLKKPISNVTANSGMSSQHMHCHFNSFVTPLVD